MFYSVMLFLLPYYRWWALIVKTFTLSSYIYTFTIYVRGYPLTNALSMRSMALCSHIIISWRWCWQSLTWSAMIQENKFAYNYDHNHQHSSQQLGYIYSHNSIELLYAAVNRCQQNIIDSSIHHNWKSTSMIIKFPLIIITYLQVFINIYSTIL